MLQRKISGTTATTAASHLDSLLLLIFIDFLLNEGGISSIIYDFIFIFSTFYAMTIGKPNNPLTNFYMFTSFSRPKTTAPFIRDNLTNQDNFLMEEEDDEEE